MIAVFLAAAFLAGCSGGAKSGETVDTDHGTYSDSEHGKVISVTYSCAGGQTAEEDFSFYASEEDEGFAFSYFYFDFVGGRLEGELKIGEEDMNEIRRIIDKYGYSELVGQRTEPDFGNDEALDAPTYYLSVSYEDARSMSTTNPGEGGRELEAFFISLAEKGDQ